MRVISLLNQKGGVGKTSTCHHLAGAFSRLGLRTLLVDNDPQASLTQGFLGPEATRDLDPSTTVAAVHAGLDPHPGRLVRPTGFTGIDLVAGSRAAARDNVPEPQLVEWPRQEALAGFLAATCGYDVCLIDCPPNLHLASWAALLASDGLVVPLQPEDYGAQGIADVAESIRLAGRVNPRLRLAGYLLTKVEPRRAIHQQYERHLRASYGALVFDARVPALAAYVEAIANRKPVEQYRPRCPAAVALRLVALEFLARTGVPCPAPADLIAIPGAGRRVDGCRD